MSSPLITLLCYLEDLGSFSEAPTAAGKTKMSSLLEHTHSNYVCDHTACKLYQTSSDFREAAKVVPTFFFYLEMMSMVVTVSIYILRRELIGLHITKIHLLGAN